jgi:KUP system potassium uptake protein
MTARGHRRALAHHANDVERHQTRDDCIRVGEAVVEHRDSGSPLESFIRQVHGKARVSGTAVYLTSRLDVVPVPLLHNLKHNKVLHERIVLLRVATRQIPRVPADKRLEIVHLGDNFHSVVAYYGFMQYPNIPRVLVRASQQGLAFDMMDTSFFVGSITILPERSSRLSAIRTNLFEVMHRNALPATEFFRIPPKG